MDYTSNYLKDINPNRKKYLQQDLFLRGNGPHSLAIANAKCGGGDKGAPLTMKCQAGKLPFFTYPTQIRV